MTKAELIKALEPFPEDMEVVMQGDGPISSSIKDAYLSETGYVIVLEQD